MTSHTDPNHTDFNAVLDTEIHLCCTSDADAYGVAESRDEVRMELQALHLALRAGADTVPPVTTRCWESEFQGDRAAAALLATEAGQPYLKAALRRLPHVHYWLRGGQLITEIVAGQLVSVRGLPGTYDVWAVFDTGQIVVGDDDLMAVFVERDAAGHTFARVLLFTGTSAFVKQAS